MVVHHDSVLDVEHQTTHLSKLHRAHGEPLIVSKSSNVVSLGITFTALDLITQSHSPFVPQRVLLYGNVFPATCQGATSPS